MSIYGNIKKVESSAFQFDRVYSSRVEMEQKALIDGVYAGRYVLIDYGARFGVDYAKADSDESINYMLNHDNIEYIYAGQPHHYKARLTDDAKYALEEENTTYDINKIYYFTETKYIAFSGTSEDWKNYRNSNILYIMSGQNKILVDSSTQYDEQASYYIKKIIYNQYDQISNQSLYDLFKNLHYHIYAKIIETPTNHYQLIHPETVYNNVLTYYINNGSDNYIIFTGTIAEWREKRNTNQLYIKVDESLITYNEITSIDDISANQEYYVFIDNLGYIPLKPTEELWNILNNNHKIYIIKDYDVQENENYIENANKDLNAYGAIYDSTIWQKIYLQNQDQYIMIAELNAMVPKIEIKEHEPYSYNINNSINPKDGIIVGSVNPITNQLNEIVKLKNAKEVYNPAYFDTSMDTEFSYLLHHPKNLQLEANDNIINYNKNGFNIAYSYGEMTGPSTIALVPKINNNYIKTGEYDSNNIPYARLTKNSSTSSKSLYLNFPAIGNAMNTIYDLIYGIPDAETEDITHGVLRPYFRQFLHNKILRNNLIVTNKNPSHDLYTLNEKIQICIDNEPKYAEGYLETYENGGWLPVEFIPNYSLSEISIEKSANQYELKTITPDFIQIRYRHSDGTIEPNTNIKTGLDNTLLNNLDRSDNGDFILFNSQSGQIIKWKMKIPAGDEDPTMLWLKDIPELKELVNDLSASGLASILSNLFGEKDPLTGNVKYYLYNDWTATSGNGANIPMILNKPNIVGGYSETFIKVLARAVSNAYETDGALYKLTDDGYKISNDNLVDYPHYEIKTESNLNNGQYIIDYTTWQLVTNLGDTDLTIPANYKVKIKVNSLSVYTDINSTPTTVNNSKNKIYRIIREDYSANNGKRFGKILSDDNLNDKWIVINTTNVTILDSTI